MTDIKTRNHNNMFFKIRYDILVCLFLVAATIAVYWQIGNHTFVNYDADKYVTDNQHVQAGLTSESITWAFTSTHASNWHPLTWLSHMVDCQFYGLNPKGHHLTNVLFHILNSILLFLIFRRMTGDLWKSAFVAALFAIHPLHVESVAWVAERKDVLSTFFWMLTMGSYVWYVEHPGTSRYLMVFLFFILGLMAKPMLVTLPFVLLLLDYWPLGRFKFRRSERTIRNSTEKSHNLHLIWEKMPLLAFAAASSVVTFLVQQSGGAVRSFDVLPLTVRISNALVSYVSYLIKMIWPLNLAVLYPYYGILTWWKIAGAFFFIVLISFIVIKTVRRYPYLTIGWLWYLGTLVPVIGLVQVGSQSMADRYTYVPLIGIFIIIAWGVSDLAARWRYRKEGLAAVSAILLSILTVITWFQVRHWNNSITLFTHAINVTENNWIAHHNLGSALFEDGRTAEAINHYNEALKINPVYAEPHYNLGNVLAGQGKLDEAVSHYHEALRINPDHTEAHNNLGNALVKQKRFAEALDHYSEALRINPDFIKAHYNLGATFAEQGKAAEAIDHFTSALKINPDYVEAHNNLGNVLAKQGRVAEAIDHYSEALRINHDNAKVHNNLGSALVEQERTVEAIDHFTSALKINPDYAEAHYNLGNALARQGKLDEAIGHYSEALRINPDDAEARSNLETALAVLKETDAAIKKLQKLLEVNPGNPEMHYDLGNLYYKKRKLDEAIYHYQKSLSLQPDAVQVLNNLAIAYMTKKEHEKAVSTFNRMAELQPDNAGIYYNIACIYSRQNKIEKSLESLKKAIEKGYDNWDLIKTDKDLENIRNSLYYEKLMSSR